MTDDRLKKIRNYLFWNIGMGALAYFGYAMGNETSKTWFAILAIFGTAFISLIAILLLVVRVKFWNHVKEMTTVKMNDLSSVPRCIDIIYDVAMIAFLTHFGAWYMLGVYTLHIVAQTFIVDTLKAMIYAAKVEGGDSEDEDRDEMIRLGMLDDNGR